MAQVALLGCHSMDQFSWGGRTKADHKQICVHAISPNCIHCEKIWRDTGSTRHC